MRPAFEERIAARPWEHIHWTSITEVLRARAQEEPDHLLFTFLADGEREEDCLTCQQLDQQARSIAAWLQQRNLAGQRILLPFPPGLDFIRGFMGCLYAGAVAVPMYPPRKGRQDERLMVITEDARPAAVFCLEEFRQDLVDYIGGKAEVLAIDTLPDLSEAWVPPALARENLAFIQYTSGSTGTPRGVMVTHGNALHNAWYLSCLAGTSRDASIASWQPFFHDMGLVGSLIWPIVEAGQGIIMAPAAFLQKPIRWLRAIAKYRAEIIPTPNFGLELCATRTTPEEREGLDLACVTGVVNGAEPIRAATLEKFTSTFAPYGFRNHAHMPCFGMAEATVCITGTPPEHEPLIIPVDAQAFERHEVVPVSQPDSKSVRKTSSGFFGGGFDVRIVEPEACTVCPPDRVGEIWIAGPSVAQGYWERPDETEKTFHARLADSGEGPFLRTGDLGFLHQNQLFVTGRLKDLIIIRGRNVYPQDIERVVEASHPALEIDSCAAFSVEIKEQEELAIVVEIKRAERRKADMPAMLADIRAAVVEHFEVTPCWIGILAPHRTPKTSSGKIRHAACGRMFENREFETLAEWQPHVANPQSNGKPPTHPQSNEALRGCPPAERKRRIVAHLQNEIKETLALERLPAPTLGFERIGVDSMLAVDLVKRLQAWLGDDIELPATLLFDQPNIDAIATYVEQQFTGSRQEAFALRATASDSSSHEPIAVIGMACRFPGASDIDAYWNLLREGCDAIGPIPADRWNADAYYDADPHTPGRMYTREGGFVKDALEFDAPFFDLSPREVLAMDPQQRMALEVTWAALEHAGIAPASRNGKPVGVFMGVSTADYRQLLLSLETERDESMLPTGTAQCAVAGRISYTLGLTGPSVVLDSACSSSIVAMHQAMQALRLGDCSEAIAGGVNVMMSPDVTVGFCRAGMLSADARCKAFSAEGSGYGRGEGCGIVVLKRLSDALRDGNRVLCILRGSAVNQDGKTSGLTAPSGPSQSAVIASALQAARVEPPDVQYLECHGTGTPLGDPIEVQAADAIYTQGRDKSTPLLIGSAKSNVGHLEAAAGMAGLFKVVLSLQHRMIPPSLHAMELNPHIRWDNHNLKVNSTLREWPEPPAGKPRLGAVSSFGFVGTNAHIIVQEPPEPKPVHAPASTIPAHRLLCLSARSEAALQQLASQYAAWMSCTADLTLGRICFHHNTGRNQFEERATLITDSTSGLSQQLDALAAGKPTGGMERGSVGPTPRRVGFLFTGQGAQYAGMGRELYEAEPVFRACIDACAAAYAELQTDKTGPSLQDVLFSDACASHLKQTLYAQPAIYALQVALTAQWQAWGVAPVAVVGHSLGEYAAAFTVGAFSAAEGMRLVLRRAQLMETMPPGGAMASVTAPAADIEAALVAEPDVSISAYNGLNTVISGPAERLEALLETFKAQGLYCMRLPASNAFHSATVDPIADAFEQFAQTIPYNPIRDGLISTLTGEPVPEGSILDARHWRMQARQAVRFAQGMKTVFEHAQCDTVIEIGPKAELMWLAQMCWRPAHAVIWASSLEAKRDAHAQLLSTAAKIHALGVNLDLHAMEAPWASQHAPLVLPSYPFQHVRYCPDIHKTPGSPEQNLFYDVAWKSIQIDAGAEGLSGGWLLLADASTRPLVKVLQTSAPASACVMQDALASQDIAALQTTITQALANPELVNVILAWTPPLAPDADMAAWQQVQLLGVETALLVSQALIKRGGEGRLWIVTRAAQATAPGETTDPGQAALWGYARTFGVEHPDRFGGILDLAHNAEISACTAPILAALRSKAIGWQIALRNQQHLSPHMRPAAAPTGTALKLAPNGSYLITGGTGALGIDIARYLATQGARHIVLASRRGADAMPEGTGHELEARGCRITVCKTDAAKPLAMDDLLDTIARTTPDMPLRGVVHAAGILEGELTTSMDIPLLRKVMEGKAGGAWALHRAVQSRKLDLDFFVLFSSAAALLGIRGHANYSAANAFLDGLAHYRKSLGLPAVAINWGPWASHGMATQMEEAEWEAMGSRLLNPAVAMDAFGKLAIGPVAQCSVQILKTASWVALAASGMLPPVLETFMREITAQAAPDTAQPRNNTIPEGDGPLVKRLRGMASTSRPQAMQDALLEEVGKILGLPPAKINPDMGFFDSGMNSIMAVELSNRIQKQLGSTVAIRPVDIFNHPTVLRLGKYLLENLSPDETIPETQRGAHESLPAEIEQLDRNALQVAFDAAFGTISSEGNLDDTRMRAALHELTRLRTELMRTTEPIAIVGIGCRIPGAVTPEEFWHILDQGLDMITEVPPDRWNLDEIYDPDPDQPGKTNARHGGFVKDIDMFDADFFGISPREAKSLDPQQRMVLETTWHALENANIPADSLRGTRGAVYLGIGVTDYATRIAAQGRDKLDAYVGTGNALAAAAGRVAFRLGWHGPALSIDTACSSSLVAIHEACACLRRGECDHAIAGGVNILLSPDITIALSRAHMLSPDGRCKAFDASGNGFVRSEGCSLIVLKRLSDARKDGNRVLALIRGSAANQDGDSSGLTVPNGIAQEQVIHAALRNANLEPADIQYLECHGTGTSLGDPIEVQAANAAYCRGRPADKPLILSTVKTNVGHLETAAGATGLIKLVLALQHEVIPRSLHYRTPNPHIPWNDLNVKVAAEPAPWPASERRFAAISAFGFTGTNCHLIVESAPPAEPVASTTDQPTPPEREQQLLVLSARSHQALTALAARYTDWISERPPVALPDICHTASTRRTHLEARAALLFSNRDQLLVQLRALAEQADADGLFAGETSRDGRRPRIGFLCTGQGSQYFSMGRKLYAAEPVFRNVMDACATVFDAVRGDERPRPLLQVMGIAEPPDNLDPDLLNQTGYTQPALFAIELALATLWREWGIVPDAVLGHSLGEYTAAVLAGVFDLETGMALVAERSRLMQSIPSGGCMIAVSGPVDAIEEAIANHPDINIAAYNGGHTVLSGPANVLEPLGEQLASSGCKCKKLKTSHAFHSAQMDSILTDFERYASNYTYNPATIRLISNVSGAVMPDNEIPDASYWARHIRQPVRFAQGMEALAKTGCDILLEIGPHPVLTTMGQRCGQGGINEPPKDPVWIASLRQNQDDIKSMITAAAQLFTSGAPLRLDIMDRPWHAIRKTVDLPLYPFQRKRHWVDEPLVSPATAAPLATRAFQLEWQPLDTPSTGKEAQQSQEWIVIGSQAASAFAKALETKGHIGKIAATSTDAIRLRAEESTHIAHVLTITDEPHAAANLADLKRAQARGVHDLLLLVQYLCRSQWRGKLWIITQATQHVGAMQRVLPDQAPLWGFGKCIGMEHPEFWGGLLDLPDTLENGDWNALVPIVTGDGLEDLLALRAHHLYAARLIPAPAPPSPLPLQLRTDATYLITGGLGGVGLKAAKRLADRGARRIILTSRNLPSESARAEISRIATSGCLVDIVQADIATPEGVDALMQQCTPDRPLRGIIHAAGIESFGTLEQITTEELEKALAAKVYGSWLLAQAIRNSAYTLDFFICTASIASVWGSIMQAAYAAGNAYLDAFCAARKIEGLPATAISYGPWAEVGMGAANTEALDWMRSRGIRPLSPQLALDAMENAAATTQTGVTIVDVNWNTFKELAEVQRPRPIFARLGATPVTENDAGPASAFTVQLSSVKPGEQTQTVRDAIRQRLAKVLGCHPGELHDDTSFFDVGMDSLMTVEFRNAIQKWTGIKLSVSLVYEHHNIAALAAYLLSTAPGDASPAQVSSTAQSSVPEQADGVLDAVLVQASGYTVRHYIAGDREKIVALMQSHYGSSNAAIIDQTWEWKHEQNPFNAEKRTFLLVIEHDDHIVGIHGGYASRIRLGDNTYPVLWGCDTLVHPDHRQASGLLSVAMDRANAPLFLGTPVASFYRDILEPGGETTLLETYVRHIGILRLTNILRTRRVPSLIAHLTSACLSPIANTLMRLSARCGNKPDRQIAPLTVCGPEVDALWHRVASGYGSLSVRDASFLSWRFMQCPIHHYSIYGAWQNGQLAGYIVTRTGTRNGMLFGMIVDLLAARHDRDTLRALIAHAVQTFRTQSVDVVECLVATHASETRTELRRAGLWITKSDSERLVCPTSASQESLIRATDWYCTLGDSDLDLFR
jgi:acyl transferase domain-containing protein/acyl-CoA synthetase (AMP-forming)/AMP-acid ligase II